MRKEITTTNEELFMFGQQIEKDLDGRIHQEIKTSYNNIPVEKWDDHEHYIRLQNNQPWHLTDWLINKGYATGLLGELIEKRNSYPRILFTLK